MGRLLLGESFIKNPSFEVVPTFVATHDGASGNQKWFDGSAAGSSTNPSSGWGLRRFSGTLTARFDPTDSHSGSACMAITPTVGAHAEIGTHPYGLAGAPNHETLIKVTPSTAYILSAWIKLASVTNYGVRIYKREFRADFSEIGEAGPTAVTGTQDWTQQSLSFTTNAACHWLYVAIRLGDGSGTNDPTGVIKVDDWSLILATPPTRSLAP